MVAGLALVALIAEHANVSLSRRVVVSVSLLPALFAAVLLGPLAAMLVYSVSAFGLRFPFVGRVTYAANRALVGAVTGLVAHGMATVVPSHTGGAVAAATVGAMCAGTIDVSLTTVTYTLRGNRDWLRLLTELLPMVIAASPFYASVVALLVLGYSAVSPWTLPLFFAPALAAQRFFVLYQDQRRLTSELVNANETLERANLSFASALVATLDARDRYTAGHSAAVAVYARDIAARMGLSEEQQQLAHLCGLVHDIGKIGLPPGVLEKPGALSADERAEMQRHSEIGERILSNVDTYAEIASIVRHHHERLDGAGYPDGLAGNEIPLLSRIIAVADAYNAMTSDRPYRDAMPSHVARLRLAEAVETQFDTAVVAAFEAILATSAEPYRVGSFGLVRPMLRAEDGSTTLSALTA
ncbi:MAG: HD-GYP domain-containing protein [Actinobacteria bacterium]|nr:HD-GYP domain-containing protein [Actinomycetota bacterium]